MPKVRGSGEGGLYYVKSRGHWRGVADAGFHPDGRRNQKYVYGKTKAEAREKLKTLMAEIKEHGAPLDKTTTVAAWSERWLREICEPSMKPAALQGYESAVAHWINPRLGHKRLATLKPSDVRALALAAFDAGRAPATALKNHSVLSSMLEAARLEGLVARNVVKDVKPPSRKPVNARGALDTEIALRVLAKASERPDGVRWWFAILTGMRQGERIGATIDSIDVETQTFTVQWSQTVLGFRHGCGDTCGKKKAGYCPQRVFKKAHDLEYIHLPGRLALVRPKSGRPRTFPLPPALFAALVRYLDTATHPNPHGLIWRNADGSPITEKQDQEEWRQLLLEAGVISVEQAKQKKDRAEGTPETPTTHFARHTTATVLMELGVDAKIIGEIVGHVDVTTTQRYQHVSTPAARAALEAIDEHFQGALALSR